MDGPQGAEFDGDEDDQDKPDREHLVDQVTWVRHVRHGDDERRPRNRDTPSEAAGHRQVVGLQVRPSSSDHSPPDQIRAPATLNPAAYEPRASVRRLDS